jgi:rare lipoprotein A
LLIVPLLLLQNGSDAAASTAPHDGTAPTLAAAAQATTTRPPAEPRVHRAEPAPSRPARHRPPPESAVVSRHPATAARAPATTAPVETTTPAVVARSVFALRMNPAPVSTGATSTTTTTSTTAPPAAVVADGTVGTDGAEGQVTYYAHPAGTCASPWLPFGTVVRVTNPANGATVTCLVNDREADTARALDLATATFARIAPLSQGVVDAELSW